MRYEVEFSIKGTTAGGTFAVDCGSRKEAENHALVEVSDLFYVEPRNIHITNIRREGE